MNSSEFDIDPERVRRLVLARLLVKVKKPLSRAELIAAVADALSPPLNKASAKSAAGRAMEECAQAGHVSLDGKPGLTASGEQALPALFGTTTLPRFKTWRHAQQFAALSVIGRANGSSGALEADALAARVLAAHHGLPPEAKTSAQVVNRIAWRALGVDTDAPFTVNAVQRHLLREIVPADIRVNQDQWRRMLAMRVVGAEGHDSKALTRALLCKPARRSPDAAAVKPLDIGNQNGGAARLQFSLSDFARAVHSAAASPGVARFHDDRAYIGSVWEHMHGRSPIGDMSLAEFKQQLVTAHRERLLRISRADLVGAMDPAEVERSEAHYQNATFHFVALEAGGVR